MTIFEWWKNYGLGLEIDVSGTFIFNGIKRLDNLEAINNVADVFEILYNLSVGIERIFKVTVVLLEHKEEYDIEEMEKSLITHNVLELYERINKIDEFKISDDSKEFLALLTNFYNKCRYNRFNLNSIKDIEIEKNNFINFLSKNLKLAVENHNHSQWLDNSDQIKRYIGKMVMGITRGSYNIMKKKAEILNIYTYEIRSGSKATKVFLGDKLDFFEENQIKREIIAWLANPKSECGILKYIRSLPHLEIDPSGCSDYIKSLFDDQILMYSAGEFDEAYSNLDDIGKRFKLLSDIKIN
jgi:hypothetical protein